MHTENKGNPSKMNRTPRSFDPLCLIHIATLFYSRRSRVDRLDSFHFSRRLGFLGDLHHFLFFGWRQWPGIWSAIFRTDATRSGAERRARTSPTLTFLLAQTSRAPLRPLIRNRPPSPIQHVPSNFDTSIKI